MNEKDQSHNDQRSIATIQPDQKIDIEKPIAYATYATSCNHFHNILRLFYVLPNFPFTTSEKQWAIITYKHGIYELPHELPNDLRHRILGN